MITISIQAGGRSVRMGENKAVKKFLGVPLIQRVVDRVKPVAGEMNIITADPDPFRFLGLPAYPDRYTGRGLLGGIFTALSVSNLEYVAPVGCDMPFLSAALITAEMARLEAAQADVVIPETARGLEPLHAVYRRDTCLAPAEKAILDGEWRVISWFQQVKVVVLNASEVYEIDSSPYLFMNLNTPEEFEAAEEIARKGLD